MGNSRSDVNDSLKAQAGGVGPVPESYKLLSVDSGELIRLQKLANHTKDYTMLDDVIRNQVIKFLYNGGQGEHVILNYLTGSEEVFEDSFRFKGTRIRGEKGGGGDPIKCIDSAI